MVHKLNHKWQIILVRFNSMKSKVLNDSVTDRCSVKQSEQLIVSMLPLDTSNNFQGSCLSKNVSTKSESFVTTTQCCVNEKVISADRWYDSLLADRAYELFQVLSRVTGERDVVEVEHNEKLHATIGSMRFIWLSCLAKSNAARISSRSKSS